MFSEIAKEVEDVLYNTRDIIMIDEIVSAIEEMRYMGNKETKELLVPTSHGKVITVITKDYDAILVNLLKTCVKIEEYEMCARINQLTI